MGIKNNSRVPAPQDSLWKILWSEQKDLWVVIIYGVFAGILSLAVPIAVQTLVNTIGFGSMMQPIVVLTTLVLIILGFAGALRAMQSFVMEIIQQRIFARIAIDLAYRLPRVRIESFDSNQSIDLVNRFFDVLVVQKSAAIIILDGIAIILQTSLGMILLAFYHPYLLAFDFLLAAGMLFVIFPLGKEAISTSIDESISKYQVAAWLQELVRNPLTFRSTGGPEIALKRTDQLTAEYIHHRRDHFQILLRQIIGSVLVQVIASTLLLGLGGWLVIQRQLTLGQLVASELVVTLVVAGFTKFGKYLETYYDLVAAADKLDHLLNLPLEKQGGESLPHLSQQTEPASVRMRGVTFQYQKGVKSLSELNLEIKKGSRVGVLGSNGSGKSTLVSLVYGLREPEIGTIEIDGVDLREISLEKMRLHIGFVRGVEIFHGTIFENVSLQRPHVTLQDVREVLDSLGLLDYVTSLPEGLMTSMVGHPPLSAGQIQRLMIARAIVGKPRLLILDESLDSIDAESYPRVLDVLFNPAAPWTLILTTHNEAISSRCDEVYVLQGGKMRKLH